MGTNPIYISAQTSSRCRPSRAGLQREKILRRPGPFGRCGLMTVNFADETLVSSTFTTWTRCIRKGSGQWLFLDRRAVSRRTETSDCSAQAAHQASSIQVCPGQMQEQEQGLATAKFRRRGMDGRRRVLSGGGGHRWLREPELGRSGRDPGAGHADGRHIGLIT